MAVIAVSLHLRGETLRADAKDLSGANPDFGIVLHLRAGDEDISIFDLTPERMEALADAIRAEALSIRADRADRALLAAEPIDTEVGSFEVTDSIPHPECAGDPLADVPY